MDQKVTSVVKRAINCPVCGSSEYRIKFPDELGDRLALVDYDFKPDTQKVYQIVNCAGCSFIYTNPVPDLGAAYADTVDDVYLNSVDQRRNTAERNVHRIKKRIPSGRILDVGCNIGVFLDAAADAGFEAEGIELSDWARGQAGKRHVVYGDTLDTLAFEGRYDAVTLWGVIEHLQDPAAVMRQVHKALKPGGYVFIYTGDVDSVLAKIMGRRWYWYMGMHLMYFSGATLKRMLAKIGFSDFRYERHTSYFALSSLATSMRRYNILSPVTWLLRKRLFSGKMIALTLSGEMLLTGRKH